MVHWQNDLTFGMTMASMQPQQQMNVIDSIVKKLRDSALEVKTKINTLRKMIAD